MCVTDILLSTKLKESAYPIAQGNITDDCLTDLTSFDEDVPASPASLVGIGGLQVIAALVACFCVAKSSATKVAPDADDEAKDVKEDEDLKSEVMELVEVENEVNSDDSDESDNNNEDKGEESDVDEEPKEKTEDVNDDILETEEVNYTNKERRRTTIISIDKEELEDIFKDNTIEEEDGEDAEDRNEVGSDASSDAGDDDKAKDDDEDADNEGLWFRFSLYDITYVIILM